MKCDCCGKEYYNMYRTVDTRVYCLPCSKRDSMCCYGTAVVPSTRIRCEPGVKRVELEGLSLTKKRIM